MQGPSQGLTYKVRIFCNNTVVIIIIVIVIIIIIISATKIIVIIFIRLQYHQGGKEGLQLLVGRTIVDGDVSQENRMEEHEMKQQER